MLDRARRDGSTTMAVLPGADATRSVGSTTSGGERCGLVLRRISTTATTDAITNNTRRISWTIGGQAPDLAGLLAVLAIPIGALPRSVVNRHAEPAPQARRRLALDKRQGLRQAAQRVAPQRPQTAQDVTGGGGLGQRGRGALEELGRHPPQGASDSDRYAGPEGAHRLVVLVDRRISGLEVREHVAGRHQPGQVRIVLHPVGEQGGKGGIGRPVSLPGA